MTLTKIGAFTNISLASVLVLHQLLFLNLGASLYLLPSSTKWVTVIGVLELGALLSIAIWFFTNKKKHTSIIILFNILVSFFFIIYLQYSFVNGSIEYLEMTFRILLPFSNLVFGYSIFNSIKRAKTLINLAAALICFSAILHLFHYYISHFNPFGNSMQISEIIDKYSQIPQIATSFVFSSIFLIDGRTFETELNRIVSRILNLIAILNIVVLCSTIAVFMSLIYENKAQNSPSNITQKARFIAARFKADSFEISPGGLMRYRLMLPFQQASGKKYPLVILLHHGGAHGVDNVIQVESSFAPYFASYSNTRKFPAFLFIPQCPKGVYWTSNSIDRQLQKTIKHLEDLYPIDTNRRYMVGLSEGGMGVWHYAVHHPDLLAAAVPISGPVDTLGASHVIKLPIWAFHGALDESVPVQNTRDMIDAIRSAGGRPKYTEFPNIGHNTAKEIENTKGLLEWLFGQSKTNEANILKK